MDRFSNDNSAFDQLFGVPELSALVFDNVDDFGSVRHFSNSCRRGRQAADSYAPISLDAERLRYIQEIPWRSNESVIRARRPINTGEIRRIPDLDPALYGNDFVRALTFLPNLEQVTLTGTTADVFGDDITSQAIFRRRNDGSAPFVEYFDAVVERTRQDVELGTDEGRLMRRGAPVFSTRRLPSYLGRTTRYRLNLTAETDFGVRPAGRFKRASAPIFWTQIGATSAPYDLYCDPAGRIELAEAGRDNHTFITEDLASALALKQRSPSTGKHFGTVHVPCFPSEVSAFNEIAEALKSAGVECERVSFSSACGRSEIRKKNRFSKFSEVMAGAFWRDINAPIISVDVGPWDIDLENVIPNTVHPSLTEIAFVLNGSQPDGEELGAYCARWSPRSDITFKISRIGGKVDPDDSELNMKISASAKHTRRELSKAQN